MDPAAAPADTATPALPGVEHVLGDAQPAPADGVDKPKEPAAADGTPAEGGDAAADGAEGASPDKDEKTGEAKTDPVDDVVPEGAYEFKYEDGRELDPGLVDIFTPVLKEFGVTQGRVPAALDAFDKALAHIREADVKAFVDETAAWRKQAEEDPEIGGANWAKTKVLANAALQKFGTPHLTAVLRETGLSNHPEMIRLFRRMAESTGDDVVDPGNGAAGSSEPVEANWYKTTPTKRT